MARGSRSGCGSQVWRVPLAEAGVEYVVLDDTHFLAAGLEPARLHGIYITEEQGAPLRLVPSLKSFRYTIPFREPEETVRILRKGRNHPGQLFAVGDDCEKFGVWPGTYAHVYENGWLEKFLERLGKGERLARNDHRFGLHGFAPSHRTSLSPHCFLRGDDGVGFACCQPSWNLKACLDETENMRDGERFRRFLQGGFWRNFLSKYPESNQIQKLMCATSRRWHALSACQASGKRGDAAFD